MQVELPEGAANMADAPDVWQPLKSTEKAMPQESNAGSEANGSVSCNSMVAGAVLVGFLAVAAGLGYILL